MADSMILKRITNKRGSYITEASISLPIFIIAIIVMSSVILMYACIENSTFIIATELRRASCEALLGDEASIVPGRIIRRIKAHSQVSNIRIDEYGYRKEFLNNDEIILIRLRLLLRTDNPIGIASEAESTLSCVTRAYVGKIGQYEPMSAEEFEETGDETVFVFPKAGERYHNKVCNVLKAASKAVALTESVRKTYSSCSICKSGGTGNGSLVYVFPSSGEAYHLPSCKALDRNYIEIMKRTARKRGYTPCLKCGG